MKTRWGWIRGPLLVAFLVGLMAVPDSLAKGPRGGRSGGRGGRAPRQSAPRRQNRGPNVQSQRMPQASAAARGNQAARSNNMTMPPRANNARSNANLSGTNRTSGLARSAATTGTNPNTLASNSYQYGTGSRARQYHAYGYGKGYRNRSSRSGQGRSQGTNRAIVSRLRSVHKSLARLDHNYQGHRVRAMQSISTAVRQLSHRSTSSIGNGFASVGTNGRNGALGNANGIGNANRNANGNGVANNGNRRTTHLTQAQSDGRMSQAMRTTQGIHRQLGSQGPSSRGHSGARTHLARAIHEMNTALTIR